MICFVNLQVFLSPREPIKELNICCPLFCPSQAFAASPLLPLQRKVLFLVHITPCDLQSFLRLYSKNLIRWCLDVFSFRRLVFECRILNEGVLENQIPFPQPTISPEADKSPVFWLRPEPAWHHTYFLSFANRGSVWQAVGTYQAQWSPSPHKLLLCSMLIMVKNAVLLYGYHDRWEHGCDLTMLLSVKHLVECLTNSFSLQLVFKIKSVTIIYIQT